MERYVFTLIGVTSYTLTGGILLALRSGSDMSMSSLYYDCIFRAMEIIVA